LLLGAPPHIGKSASLAGSVVLCCFGLDAGGRLAVIQPMQAITMLSAEKEAHRRRVLEHLTHIAASDQRSVTPTRTEPQFAIHLVGEVCRNKAEPHPSRRRSESANQPDLRGI